MSMSPQILEILSNVRKSSVLIFKQSIEETLNTKCVTNYVHFQQDIEATVNLKCVTNGSLKIPRGQFNLESGRIKFSLRVKDSAWEPRLDIEKWDAVTRTLTEVECVRIFHNFHDVKTKQQGGGEKFIYVYLRSSIVNKDYKQIEQPLSLD